MNKEILRLAIPNIITNITVPLLGMVDTAIVGHLESELYIGAIALAAMIFNFVYWNFAFLRMGTSGFTAQAYGAGNRREMMDSLLRSLLVAFGLAFMILLLQKLIFRIAAFFITTSPESWEYVTTYYNIYVWAAPAILGMFALSGWFIGMQDARTPMYVSIATNLINIAISLLLVYGFNMGLQGVAWGSVLAQWSALLLAGGIWMKKYGFLRPFISGAFLKQPVAFKQFFRVNGDIFFRSLALVLVTTFFTSASAKNGDTVLAVNSLLMQFFILFSYMMDGFAYAAEALSGRFLGAADGVRLRQLVRRIFWWGGGLACMFTLLYILFTDILLNILTDKVAIIEAAAGYRVWAVLFPVAGFAAFLWDGIFIGMTASRQMRNSMFVAVGCFFVAYLLLEPVWGNNGLWFAFLLYLSMRGIVQTALFPGIFRSRIGC